MDTNLHDYLEDYKKIELRNGLTFVGYFGKKSYDGSRLGLFRCKCGKEFEAMMYLVALGRKISCGCYAIKKYDRQEYRPEYRSWQSMKIRCYGEGNKYNIYKVKGIIICQRWKDSFDDFVDDMGRRISLEYSLDRIDNNKSYTCGHCRECKEKNWDANCRWATKKEQSNNRSVNVVITYNDETKTLVQWAEQIGINPERLGRRLLNGWSIEKAFLTPIQKQFSHKRPTRSD